MFGMMTTIMLLRATRRHYRRYCWRNEGLAGSRFREAPMIFGMDTYTFVHVALSLIGIATGIIVFLGFIGDAPLPGLTALFLSTTVLTSATGFGFLPITKLLPSHIVGIISLVVLAIAI